MPHVNYYEDQNPHDENKPFTKSGIELIAEERQEQIKKHGFSLLMDKENENGELLRAAKFCLTPKTDNSDWPGWWKTMFKYKILEDTRMEQLAKAGAFFMAENDRAGNNNCDSDIEKVAAEIDRLQSLTFPNKQ